MAVSVTAENKKIENVLTELKPSESLTTTGIDGKPIEITTYGSDDKSFAVQYGTNTEKKIVGFNELQNLINTQASDGQEWTISRPTGLGTEEESYVFSAGEALPAIVIPAVPTAPAPTPSIPPAAPDLSQEEEKAIERAELRHEFEESRQAQKDVEEFDRIESARKTHEQVAEERARVDAEAQRIGAHSIAAQHGFKPEDAVQFNSRDSSVVYLQGDDQIIVSQDGTSLLGRKSDTGILYTIEFDKQGTPIRTNFYQTIGQLEGDYSDSRNKQIVDELHKYGYITDEQYDDIDGTWLGIGEEDMQLVYNTVKQNQEAEQKTLGEARTEHERAPEDLAALERAREEHQKRIENIAEETGAFEKANNLISTIKPSDVIDVKYDYEGKPIIVYTTENTDSEYNNHYMYIISNQRVLIPKYQAKNTDEGLILAQQFIIESQKDSEGMVQSLAIRKARAEHSAVEGASWFGKALDLISGITDFFGEEQTTVSGPQSLSERSEFEQEELTRDIPLGVQAVHVREIRTGSNSAYAILNREGEIITVRTLGATQQDKDYAKELESKLQGKKGEEQIYTALGQEMPQQPKELEREAPPIEPLTMQRTLSIDTNLRYAGIPDLPEPLKKEGETKEFFQTTDATGKKYFINKDTSQVFDEFGLPAGLYDGKGTVTQYITTEETLKQSLLSRAWNYLFGTTPAPKEAQRAHREKIEEATPTEATKAEEATTPSEQKVVELDEIDKLSREIDGEMYYDVKEPTDIGYPTLIAFGHGDQTKEFIKTHPEYKDMLVYIDGYPRINAYSAKIDGKNYLIPEGSTDVISEDDLEIIGKATLPSDKQGNWKMADWTFKFSRETPARVDSPEHLRNKAKFIDTKISNLEQEIKDLEIKRESDCVAPGGPSGFAGGCPSSPLDQQIKDKKAQLNNLRKLSARNSADIAWGEFKDQSWFFEKEITVMRSLLRSYEKFSGLAKFGSLFLTGDNWMEWRNTVSQTLCDSILFGGKQCWVSKVCDEYIDAMPEGNSLIARTPAGEPRGVVNLQAEKSLPVDVVDDAGKTQTGFLYKITYTITNPHNKKMRYNLKFNTKTTTRIAFAPEKELVEGGTDGKTGSAAKFHQSFNDYTNVCLTFTPSIETWDGRTVAEFCTPISQYQGAATNPYTNLPSAPGTCDDKIQNQREEGVDCGGPCTACGSSNTPKWVLP